MGIGERIAGSGFGERIERIAGSGFGERVVFVGEPALGLGVAAARRMRAFVLSWMRTTPTTTCG